VAVTKTRVLVSILDWNGGDAIVACLESLYRSEFGSFSVVVIDNGSTDDSIDKIKTRFPGVTVIRNAENLGFCKGQNQALGLAIEQKFDYVWMLNHDTVMDSTTLGKLVAELDANPSVAMASPVIFADNAKSRVQFCGGSLDWDAMNVRNWESVDLALRAQAIGPDTFFLWGTAPMIRVSALATIGTLDERFFAYYEDVDLSLRATRCGFQNRIVASAHIVHFAQNDASSRPAYFVYFNTRNRALFWTKHLTAWRRLGFWRRYLAGALIYASTFKDVGDKDRMDAALLAVWDALNGRGGKLDQTRHVSPRMASLVLAHPYLVADILRGNFAAILQRALGRTVVR
jgi:GT2 family glycosyltransferase